MGEIFAGRYELVDSLGHGGMGNVFRAWDHREHKYVAAKVLRQSDASALLRFVREQSYRVEHPHVVTPMGWAGEDDRVLFTMPIVRGGSVATLLGDFGRLPSAWAAALLDQLLDALSEVHSAGLVHRDVKPANLLLEPTGPYRPHLRLSDFGLAARVDEPRLTSSSVVLGTPGYCSPERLRGDPPHGSQDVYAAGMVGFEMVTGSSPGISAPPTFERPVGCAEHLWQLLCEMAAAGPDDRPTAATARERLMALALLTAPSGEAGHDPGPIEVFDHVPPLPEGWSAHGPLPRQVSGREPDVHRTRPGSAGWLPVALAVLGVVLLVSAGLLLLSAMPG